MGMPLSLPNSHHLADSLLLEESFLMALNYTTPLSNTRITINDSGDGTNISIHLPAVIPPSQASDAHVASLTAEVESLKRQILQLETAKANVPADDATALASAAPVRSSPVPSGQLEIAKHHDGRRMMTVEDDNDNGCSQSSGTPVPDRRRTSPPVERQVCIPGSADAPRVPQLKELRNVSGPPHRDSSLRNHGRIHEQPEDAISSNRQVASSSVVHEATASHDGLNYSTDNEPDVVTAVTVNDELAEPTTTTILPDHSTVDNKQSCTLGQLESVILSSANQLDVRRHVDAAVQTCSIREMSKKPATRDNRDAPREKRVHWQKEGGTNAQLGDKSARQRARPRPSSSHSNRSNQTHHIQTEQRWDAMRKEVIDLRAQCEELRMENRDVRRERDQAREELESIKKKINAREKGRKVASKSGTGGLENKAGAQGAVSSLCGLQEVPVPVPVDAVEGQVVVVAQSPGGSGSDWELKRKRLDTGEGPSSGSTPVKRSRDSVDTQGGDSQSTKRY